MGPLLPSFEPVARLRPVSLVRPEIGLGHAPYAAAETDLSGPSGPSGPSGSDVSAECTLESGNDRLTATWDGTTVALRTRLAGVERRHVSRRHGRALAPDALAITLTGRLATAWAREAGGWIARASVELRTTDVNDPGWLSDLTGHGDRVGGFGQLGMRDLRVITHADGTAYREGDEVLLSATSAGPGGFSTAHLSIWALQPSTLALEHRADLFFRRPGASGRPGSYGDHAAHVLRDGDRWLVATSTWGDFDVKRHPRVSCVLASTTADVLHGIHVLDATPLALPTDGLSSVGTWDPHLVRTDEGWLATYVSARRFFSFHPVVATGQTLDDLRLRAAASDRTACEGPTLTRSEGTWWVLASDGRDERRDRRASYPVFDLDLHQHGVLAASYPTNLPWPTIVAREPEHLSGSLLIGFDAAPYGGPLLGYGTHGEVVVQRSR